MFEFLTRLQHQDVIDRHGRWIGWAEDFTFGMEGAYPPLTGIIVRAGYLNRRWIFVPWSQIHRTTHQQQRVFQVRAPLEKLSFSSERPTNISEPTLNRNILDKQVVDTYNRKVVRVNDIHLLTVDGNYRIAHVDIGFRGMLRRIGWEPMVDRLVRLVHPHSRYLTHDQLIAWKYIQPLTINPESGALPLSISQTDLESIPPADLSEIMVELDPHQRAALFKSLDADLQGEILGELDTKLRMELIAEIELSTAIAILDRMPTDEVTDILQGMPRSDREHILGAINSRKAKKISELLSHHQDSAGGLMTTELIDIPAHFTVGEAIERIRGLSGIAEIIHYAYITDDDHHLVGMVTFRILLLEPAERPISEVMDRRPVMVKLEDSAREVAFALDKYNIFAIPVVDDNKVLHGIITVDDILSIAIDAAWGDRHELL